MYIDFDQLHLAVQQRQQQQQTTLQSALVGIHCCWCQTAAHTSSGQTHYKEEKGPHARML